VTVTLPEDAAVGAGAPLPPGPMIGAGGPCLTAGEQAAIASSTPESIRNRLGFIIAKGS
jgi:hypothetical protein